MEWDGDRRLREINRRIARLLWVEREQEKEFGGITGVFNWLVGRRRLSGKELVQRMLEEAEDGGASGLVSGIGGVGRYAGPGAVCGRERVD